jgi:hypothetical protein
LSEKRWIPGPLGMEREVDQFEALLWVTGTTHSLAPRCNLA